MPGLPEIRIHHAHEDKERKGRSKQSFFNDTTASVLTEIGVALVAAATPTMRQLATTITAMSQLLRTVLCNHPKLAKSHSSHPASSQPMVRAKR